MGSTPNPANPPPKKGTFFVGKIFGPQALDPRPYHPYHYNFPLKKLSLKKTQKQKPTKIRPFWEDSPEKNTNCLGSLPFIARARNRGLVISLRLQKTRVPNDHAFLLPVTMYLFDKLTSQVQTAKRSFLFLEP